jgi:hypothetical protein
MSDERKRYASLAELENDAEPIAGLLSQFEVDLNVLVKMNHHLTIEGIGRLEQDEIADLRKNFTDQDILDSLTRDHEVFCDDLRRNANNLARNSVIHGYSKATWQYNGKPQEIADHHRRFGELDITDDQLSEAIGNAVAQVN